MDQQEAPPPSPTEGDVKYDTNNNEEEEGEQFDFDSGDEVPEADRGGSLSALEEAGSTEDASSCGHEKGAEKATDMVAEPVKPVAPMKVNPYSVIDITPLQDDPPLAPDSRVEEDSFGSHLPSGYSVPVPCGYAVPSSLPLLLPAYSSPVIIRATSMEEEETPESSDHPFKCLISEDLPNSDDQARKEDSALARWAADPANMAWMENPEEAVYDDVPQENSDSEPAVQAGNMFSSKLAELTSV